MCPLISSKRCMMRDRNKKTFWLMLIPTFLPIILLTYYPIIKGFVMAFQNYNLYNLTNIHFIGFENFKAIITDANFRFSQILYNTLIWVIVSLFFQFVLGFGLALLMRKPFKGRGLYSGLVFYPWALSGFAIGLVWAWMFNGQFGIVNDLLKKIGILQHNVGFLSDPHYALPSVIIVNIWYGIPFFAIMLLAALQSVPQELYEAAEIDGANSFVKLFKITIPYIKPTIISTTLLRAIWIMNFPDIIYGMTNGGPANATNILATQMINKIYNFYDYGQASAIGVIIMIILFTYAVLYLRFTSMKELEL